MEADAELESVPLDAAERMGDGVLKEIPLNTANDGATVWRSARGLFRSMVELSGATLMEFGAYAVSRTVVVAIVGHRYGRLGMAALSVAASVQAVLVTSILGLVSAGGTLAGQALGAASIADDLGDSSAVLLYNSVSEHVARAGMLGRHMTILDS